MNIKTGVFTALAIILISTILSAPAHSQVTKRYLLAVSANKGGYKRPRLKYAVTDARAFINVLNKMGGVNKKDSLLVVEPDREELLQVIERFGKKVDRSKNRNNRVEIIFYYAGHADEEGVLLNGEKVQYNEIRNALIEMKADVKIAILDSCSSGAFAQARGGKVQPPFMVDASNAMKGYAFLTSSSPNEASQESDSIEGAYFTKSLISGLRGMADISKDGRITLTEAYQFAYNETLRKTEKTISGPQHPNLHVKMSGTGDVVVTEIRKSSSVLIIDKNITGRLAIRNENNDLILELNKSKGNTIQLGLDSGRYTIANEKQNKLYQFDIQLADNKKLRLTDKYVKSNSTISPVMRKDPANAEGYEYIPLSFSFIPLAEKGRKIKHGFVFNLFGSYSTALNRLALGFGPSIVKEGITGGQATVLGNFCGESIMGVQIAGISNITGNQVSGAQMSILFNVAGSDVRGYQGAAGFNVAGGSVYGAQASMLFNITNNELKGAQLSYAFNYAGGHVVGAQLSLIFNHAGSLTGGQTSLVNISGHSRGLQIGLVNISDNFEGLQLGLINIADQQDGVPIGLINISDNGGIEIVTWTSNLVGVNTGIKFRSNFVYSIIYAGTINYLRDPAGERSFTIGFNFGVHFDFWRMYLAIDIGILDIDNYPAFRINEDLDKSILNGRAMVGYKIFPWLSVFAGAGVDYIWGFDRKFTAGRFRPHFFGGLSFKVYGED